MGFDPGIENYWGEKKYFCLDQGVFTQKSHNLGDLHLYLYLCCTSVHSLPKSGSILLSFLSTRYSLVLKIFSGLRSLSPSLNILHTLGSHAPPLPKGRCFWVPSKFWPLLAKASLQLIGLCFQSPSPFSGLSKVVWLSQGQIFPHGHLMMEQSHLQILTSSTLA